jgi:hypothetical protein
VEPKTLLLFDVSASEKSWRLNVSYLSSMVDSVLELFFTALTGFLHADRLWFCQCQEERNSMRMSDVGEVEK